MTVIHGRPWFAPIIGRLVGPLPGGVVFTYGQRTYVAPGHQLPGDLAAHEREHTRQQGRFPSIWWIRYVLDRGFRFEQELAAYRVQMRYLREHGRVSVFDIDHMARSLSGAMYGRLVDYAEAKRAITVGD